MLHGDRTIEIETPDADAITSVVLVRLSTVTHSVNFEQRLLDLPYTNEGDGVLRATVPPNGNHAPPGFYMLFILNGDEVPSHAAMIQMAAWRTGDVDNDGDVDFGDMVVLLASWGECPPPPVACPADVNGDGTVDFGDVLEVLANWS